jgi:hypothetical protein
MPVLNQLRDLCGAYSEMQALATFLDHINPHAARRVEALLCAP